ncbi:nuclear transport factor 2 family protein [Roseibacterium sp. SDUM158017]|uniref:YybH family protein n=1 Tax=Roseicyclus salinarum TaxID=3036773 RepID=UPI002414FC52|nr:nuclear transport factor 2 family protein [Roseibacterium sp. SDUM158017]MDG4647059.1 nuclear transport factor 2 family protein [Roseibacterium sp. SDUM158017]
MPAESAKDLIGLFSQRFSSGDVDRLLDLYEDQAVFPTHHGTARGLDQIRSVLQGYVDSGATLDFTGQVAFETGDLALVQNAWTMTTASGDKATGVTVEIARKQADGLWKYAIDSPDGAALLGT